MNDVTVEFTLTGIEQGITALPPLLIIVVLAVVAWRVSGIKLGVFTIVTLVFIGLLGLWEDTMITLAMEHLSS